LVRAGRDRFGRRASGGVDDSGARGARATAQTGQDAGDGA
jgi:hypothetical protein